MNLESYQDRRQQLHQKEPKYRELCRACLQPEFGCYCAYIQPFDAKIKFVILIHPIEVKRRIATGRMSHLCLQGSELIKGQDYTHDRRVNEIIADPNNQPLILYPGKQSLNISEKKFTDRDSVFQKGKTPVLFVIDGTWATAKKTMNQSENLKKIPKICFTPPGPSHFRVRKQPAANCYSTIEAIHYSIELLGGQVGFATETRLHDRLLSVFDKMVERQLEFVRQSYLHPERSNYRRPNKQLKADLKPQF